MSEPTDTPREEIRFQPDPKVALGQKLGFGFIGLIAAMGVHYFKTRDSFLKSLGIGAVVAVGLVIFLIIQGRRKGEKMLILGQEFLTIEDKSARVVLPWNEIEKAQRFLHGEDRWEFIVRNRREPVSFPLYGFLNPQIAAIQAELVKRVPCQEMRTPLESRPLNP